MREVEGKERGEGGIMQRTPKMRGTQVRKISRFGQAGVVERRWEERGKGRGVSEETE